MSSDEASANFSDLHRRGPYWPIRRSTRTASPSGHLSMFAELIAAVLRPGVSAPNRSQKPRKLNTARFSRGAGSALALVLLTISNPVQIALAVGLSGEFPGQGTAAGSKSPTRGRPFDWPLRSIPPPGSLVSGWFVVLMDWSVRARWLTLHEDLARGPVLEERLLDPPRLLRLVSPDRQRDVPCQDRERHAGTRTGPGGRAG